VPPSVGMRFGRYEILSRLGAGGMGEVFRARDHDLHRDVAIKFLSERYAADPVRLGRFAQEARAASSLNHPNIITIHEIGETSGLPYMVMELVEGQTLRQLIRGPVLPSRRVLALASQLADGLAKAHGAQIVHRDLKPENVMVTGDGYVKILDFGLAKLRADPAGDRDIWFDSGMVTWPESPDSPRTAEGAVLGTVGYMSPEQARGRPVDFRSDQFSFGAIVYEMATGRQAFRRDSPPQTLTAIIEDSPEPLAELSPAFPPPARWIIDRCLEKKAADRYDSTLDLARELRNVRERMLEGDGSGPALEATLEPAPSPSRRRRRRVWGAAAAMASLAVVLTLLVPTTRGCTITPLPERKLLAVLPFANASGEADAQAFCDGLVETLTTKLTQLERFQDSLWVVPVSEVRAAGATSAAVALREFGANLVVTGSVQKAGRSVRLTANLVDAVSRRQVRAVVVDAGPGDVARLQDGLVRQVAGMLDLQISSEASQALSAGDTSVGGAWELYVEGRGRLQGYEDPANVDAAISLFQQAVQRDDDYALAYAGLGEAHWRRFQLTHDAASVDLARRACVRALELNDLLAPVHVTLGIIDDGTGDSAKALADFDEALALDPGAADAVRGRARALERLGREEEAEAAYREAVDRQPGYWSHHNHLGAFLWRRGRYPEAEACFRRVIELVPDNARGHSNLGGLLATMGRDDEAVVSLRRSLELRPNYAAASNLATLEFNHRRYAEAARHFETALALDDRDYRLWRNLAAACYWAPGRRGDARAAYRRAAELAEAAREIDPLDADLLAQLADCYAMLGEPDRARAALRAALDLGGGDVQVMAAAASVYETLGSREDALLCLSRAFEKGFPRDLIESDPGLVDLRDDPRYKALVLQPDPGSSAVVEGRQD
jgi:tetratricopeptide (TPR) repeat protein